MEPVEEGRIEREAQVSEGAELRQSVGIAGGQHSGGGGGGFAEGDGLIQHADTGAALMKFEGEGEANDAGSSDADVGLVHGISLVRSWRGYSLGVPVCSRRSDRRSAWLCENE